MLDFSWRDSNLNQLAMGEVVLGGVLIKLWCLRWAMWNKVLTLPLTYSLDARKGMNWENQEIWLERVVYSPYMHVPSNFVLFFFCDLYIYIDEIKGLSIYLSSPFFSLNLSSLSKRGKKKKKGPFDPKFEPMLHGPLIGILFLFEIMPSRPIFIGE